MLPALAAALIGLALPSPSSAQPAALQGLALQDHRLQTVSARQLAGRPVLLHFVFAGCSSICPLQLQELVQVHEALPAAVRSRVAFLSVTVDPLSDTPQALAAFARRHGADRDGWRFVGGAPGPVGQLLDRMQVFDSRQAPTQKRTQPADHRNSIYLFAADGRLLQRFRGAPVDRARLADELTRLAHPL